MLVPLLGEKVGAKQKQPYAFRMTDDSVFTFAGLWERWRDPSGEFIETCTILTTKPNSLVSDVHDRMPAIVKPDDYELWSDPGFADVVALAHCLKPFDPTLMKKYPVSTRVNRPEHDDRECAQEITVSATPTLF